MLEAAILRRTGIWVRRLAMWKSAAINLLVEHHGQVAAELNATTSPPVAAILARIENRKSKPAALPAAAAWMAPPEPRATAPPPPKVPATAVERSQKPKPNGVGKTGARRKVQQNASHMFPQFVLARS